MDSIDGGSIIIPMLINTEATTMSIIKNGTKIKNPISNARRNSLIIKAGTKAVNGVSSSFSTCGVWENP